MIITVKLPRQKSLKIESTGKRKKIKYLQNDCLFMFENEIYEKQSGGSYNLQDLNDINNPDENEYVEVYQEIK